MTEPFGASWPFMRLLKSLLPAGRHIRRPVSGLLRGLSLHLDFANETQIWLGTYERETHRATARLAAACNSFVDIGAGKGELVCWWLREFPGRPAVAVEPNPAETTILRQNITANSSIAPAEFSIWEGLAGSDKPPHSRALASLADGLPDPIFIKIDIEGAERELLADAKEFLSTRHCRLLIEVHSKELEEACSAQLRGCGYAIRVIDQAWWRFLIRERRSISHNRWIEASPTDAPNP